jgi:glycosyltransferase involved in cell wall biosynthesis
MDSAEFPKVTIVTPSYNQAEFLERTILSVINQDYPNIEYIIIDGGSTDNSVDIIKKYEHKITKWVSEPDSGQSNAINKGFKMSTGQIFNWLNSDDVLYPGAIAIAVDYLKRNPNVHMVYGDRVIIDRFDRVLSTNEGPSFNRWALQQYMKIPQETTFFTREIWEKVGGLQEQLHFTMDADLWFRFLKFTDFIHIPFFLGAYREHELSKSVEVFGPNKRSSRASEEISYLLRTHLRKRIKNERVRKIFQLINLMRLAYEKTSRKRRLEYERLLGMIPAGQK